MDGREAASPGTKKSIEPAALLLVLHVRRGGHCNVSDNAAEKVWGMKTAAPSGVLSSCNEVHFGGTDSVIWFLVAFPENHGR